MDVLIQRARVVDGTGNPWFYGDVALTGDRIADVTPVGQIQPEAVRHVVDATNMVVCPGFIDIQSHSIIPLFRDGCSVSKITQGITTEIMGETWTPVPVGGQRPASFPVEVLGDVPADWAERARAWRRFGDWLTAMVERGVSPNIGSFLSGGTLRSYTRGMKTGPSSSEELHIMRRVTAEAMEEGAFGVAYALAYPPDAYAMTEEIVQVCRVVNKYSGLYISHIRSEADRLMEAVEEALEIGRRANLPVEIYHLKAFGRRNWHKMREVIACIDAARNSGLDVTANIYPYTASATGLTALLPSWVAEGGKLFTNLRMPKVRSRLRMEMIEASKIGGRASVDAGDILPFDFRQAKHTPYVGKSLAEIAILRGQDWIETVFDLLAAEEQPIPAFHFAMSEENITLLLRQPWIKIATDEGGYNPTLCARRGPVHPRAYGTYPRVLGTYVREMGVLTLEDAIRKMTSAVANRLSILDRGRLHPGCFADIVVLDPNLIKDQATFENPHQLSIGIRDVWVNGVRVLADGSHTGAMPGRVVYGPGKN